MINVGDYLIHGIYFLFYGLVKYIPSPIGDIGRYLFSKPFMKKMGKVRIYEGTTIWYPYRIEIGSHTTLNEFVYISGYGGISIGSGVRIGNRTTILTSDHFYEDPDVPIYQQGITTKGGVKIADDVFIGANVTVLDGVSIGTHSVIGAGSVVTKDVPSYCVAAGNPARVIRRIDETEKK